MLLYINGFDHYATTDVAIDDRDTGYWIDADTGFGGQGTIEAATYTNERCLTFAFNGSGGLLRTGSKLILNNIGYTAASGSTLGIGFHFASASIGTLFGIVGLSGTGANTQNSLSVLLDTSGQMEVRSGHIDGTLRGDSGTNQMTNGTLYHVEIQIYFHATDGYVEIRVDGQTWLDTRDTGTFDTLSGTLTHLSFGARLSNLVSESEFDDLFIYDKTGTANNDWFGERNVLTLMPNGDTSQEDWTPAVGTDSYDNVDNIPPTGTDYLSSDTANHQTNLDIEGLPAAGYVINGIQVFSRAQKDAAGDALFKIGLSSNSVEDLSSDLAPTQDQYQYFNYMIEENPDTTAQWDETDIAALQVVIKRIS